MRVVLQRIKSASVAVGGEVITSVKEGFLVLVGIAVGDTDRQAQEMARKISKLRIMDDANGKMNLDIRAIGGEILSVSQFTLAASTSSGNRPGFSSAAQPDEARDLWMKFNASLRGLGIVVKEGIFGSQMQVSLVNDGPVTFVLDM